MTVVIRFLCLVENILSGILSNSFCEILNILYDVQYYMFNYYSVIRLYLHGLYNYINETV